MKIQNYINSAYYQTDSGYIKLNPYTHEKLHDVSSCDLMGAVMAIQSANKAFQQWRLSSKAERRTLVQKIEMALTYKLSEYARLEALDQALPLSFVEKYSLQSAVQTIRDYLEKMKLSELETSCQYSPVGVVAIVASWNLSLRIILDRLIPALLAGNSVTVKVSSQSPITAHILAEIVEKIGAPTGLVNILVTDHDEVKNIIINHPGVQAISFIGNQNSTHQVLQDVNRSNLQNYKKIQISSGTKNSAVVLSEPLESNYKDILNSFIIGQGQLAWNSARLFILEKHEKQWIESIQTYLSNLKASESIEDESGWTPCLKSASFDKFDEIKKQAFADKAKLIQSSVGLSNFQKDKFLVPVFTQDMSRCSTLQQDQIHAPFYILSTVKYPFDVAKYSNVSYFGFAAHLWGEERRFDKLKEALDVGLVCFNKSSIEVTGAVAGVKQSGFGFQDYQIFGAFFSNVKIIA